MDEHLLSHLKAFKNCYLLGSGALWMEFIEECAKLKMKAGSRLSLVTDHGEFEGVYLVFLAGILIKSIEKN